MRVAPEIMLSDEERDELTRLVGIERDLPRTADAGGPWAGPGS